MARKKTYNETQDDGAEADLIERGHGPHITDYDDNPEYIAAQEATKHDAAVEDEASAARVASAPTGGATERAKIKRDNFSRLASKRVTGVLERLSVLKNLANTNTYEWTQEQHDKIFDTIDEQLTEVRMAFEVAKKPKVRDKSQLRFEV